MNQCNSRRPPARKDDRIILHFDYDCFYASVFEVENPSLKNVPLAVQQKQIVVTCNYEARRRGLHKLQLITEAKKLCPDVVIVLGEDLTRFRDASKELFRYLRSFSWNGRAERLGFDEVFMDVSDIVEYNMALLNRNDLQSCFFSLSRTDPTLGFPFDASVPAGPTFPEHIPSLTHEEEQQLSDPWSIELRLRLHLASHLAQHLRLLIKEEKGYTSAVGVSTSKLLSKLVGTVHKPDAQTTLIPPYADCAGNSHYGEPELGRSNVRLFLEDYEVGLIPGIGQKMAHALRSFALGREATRSTEGPYPVSLEKVTVSKLLAHPDASPSAFERLLAGPGAPRGIGLRVWQLLNGCDDSEVAEASEIPRSISIEDSYQRLERLGDVHDELLKLACSLVKRMRADLLADGDTDTESKIGAAGRPQRWLARPKTLRMATRERVPPSTADGHRSSTRTMRSCPLPAFVFNLDRDVPPIAEQLVTETLEGLFRKLHPARFSLNLINIGVADMDNVIDMRRGRDISTMFKTQNDRLSGWRVQATPPQIQNTAEEAPLVDRRAVEVNGSEDLIQLSQSSANDVDEDEAEVSDHFDCSLCDARLPAYAIAAHFRLHDLDN